MALAGALKGLAKKKPQPLRPEGFEELQNTPHGRALWAALECLDGLCRQQPSLTRAGFQATEAALGDTVLTLYLLGSLLPRRSREIAQWAPSPRLKPAALAGLALLAALERDFSVSLLLDEDLEDALLTQLPQSAKLLSTAMLAEAARPPATPIAGNSGSWPTPSPITASNVPRPTGCLSSCRNGAARSLKLPTSALKTAWRPPGSWPDNSAMKS